MDRRQFVAVVAGARFASGESARPHIDRIDLFDAGAGGYFTYRIPGIVTTRKGTILAYCEARNPTASDWGNIDLVLRRSLDSGRTWLPPQRLPKIAGPHHKNPAALAQKLADPGWITYDNPVAIADRRTGILHFLFCYEYLRVFHTQSGDEGATFAAPVEITECFEEFRPKYD